MDGGDDGKPDTDGDAGGSGEADPRSFRQFAGRWTWRLGIAILNLAVALTVGVYLLGTGFEGWVPPVGLVALVAAPVVVFGDTRARALPAFVVLLLVLVLPVETAATEWVPPLYAAVSGADPVAARFSTEFGVRRALRTAILVVGLWVWLGRPAAAALDRRATTGDGPVATLLRPAVRSVSVLPTTGRGYGAVFRVGFAAVALTALVAVASAGFYPVTTVGAAGSGGTFTDEGVTLSVTDTRWVEDEPVELYGDSSVGGTLGTSADVLLVRVRATDPSARDDLVASTRLVVLSSGGRVVAPASTVVPTASGNPLFNSEAADRFVVGNRSYPIANQTDGGVVRWVAFEVDHEVARSGAYVRLQTRRPGPAGRWSL